MSKTACPICGKPRDQFEDSKEYLPFCSERCKNVDLAKWLGGYYRVSRPLRADDDASEEEETSDE